MKRKLMQSFVPNHSPGSGGTERATVVCPEENKKVITPGVPVEAACCSEKSTVALSLVC